jgi:two-component system sensor histidine kinase VanS
MPAISRAAYDPLVHRRPGLSARLKLTISYAGFLMLAGGVLLAVVQVSLLRYVPDNDQGLLGIAPNRYLLTRMFAPAAATALGFLLVFGVVGGWLLAGRMLAPLTRIADAARLAAHGSLSHRIRLTGPSDEFRELADVFDTMLERLESQVGEQQRFAANASHELRTPLAVSQAILDVAGRDPTYERGELIDRLRTVNTRAIDLTEALLLLSRSDRRHFTREPVDLSLVAEEAAETLLPLAEQRRITLDVTGKPVHASGSVALLLRMATNLVQNAIVLLVENTGRPLPPELVPTLTEPFQRGTRRTRTDEHDGVGLGLAIVHSIVRAHDGMLELVPRPAGGLLVTVRLPVRR